jgi:hypothetical protein
VWTARLRGAVPVALSGMCRKAAEVLQCTTICTELGKQRMLAMSAVACCQAQCATSTVTRLGSVSMTGLYAWSLCQWDKFLLGTRRVTRFTKDASRQVDLLCLLDGGRSGRIPSAMEMGPLLVVIPY